MSNFENLRPNLGNLSKVMSKPEFITLACALRSKPSDALKSKVAKACAAVEAMLKGKRETGDWGDLVANIRVTSEKSIFYGTHIEGECVYGWQSTYGAEFESGWIRTEDLMHVSCKFDLDFEPGPAMIAMQQEGSCALAA